MGRKIMMKRYVITSRDIIGTRILGGAVCEVIMGIGVIDSLDYGICVQVLYGRLRIQTYLFTGEFTEAYNYD